MKMVVCAECGNERRLVALGLCSMCYQRQRRADVSTHRVCVGCGELRYHAAKGLCVVCYTRSQRRVCKVCGETKRPAAKGMCARCYKRSRNPHMDERTRAREDTRDKADAEAAKILLEQQQRRCRTCKRVLSRIRSRVVSDTRFCDRFCIQHHPDSRAARGSKAWHPRTLEELQRRQAAA